MTPRALRRLLAVYAALLFVACVSLREYVALGPPSEGARVVSYWEGGQRVDREVLTDDGTTAKRPGTKVVEVAVGEAPLLSMHPALFLFALVPGRDGVRADLDGKTVYATVDDLLSMQAYDRGTTFMDASFGVGTHRGVVLHVLASQLGVTPTEMLARASFRRVRLERRPAAEEPPAAGVRADDVTPEIVRGAVAEAARYLARGVDDRGRFRYLVNAPSDVTIPGYNWPRHSGATYFLAQAAALLDDAEIRYACLRAASLLRDQTMKPCGKNRCVADDDLADVGSSALALVAFAEIVRTGADGSYRHAAAELAAFLRDQQRPDGELMHLYERSAARPVDVQYLYYTGEAALALSRAHAVTGDPRDLEAARRALDHLAGKGWSFFGSRYYFSEEHWTCQAVADLWDRAPNEEGLRFCLRWHEYQRRLQHVDGDSPFDAEGAFGFGPMVSPRVTPASSRGEAAVAALDALLRGGRAQHEDHVRPVELELRRALAFVLRSQLRPGPSHLFAEPSAIRGAMPGSPVDWQIRIDYAQHAGSMMVRWLEVRARDDYPQP